MNRLCVKNCVKKSTSIPEQTVTIVYDSSKSTFDDFVAAFKKKSPKIRKFVYSALIWGIF